MRLRPTTGDPLEVRRAVSTEELSTRLRSTELASCESVVVGLQGTPPEQSDSAVQASTTTEARGRVKPLATNDLPVMRAPY
jgi:hypothetical protein